MADDERVIDEENDEIIDEENDEIIDEENDEIIGLMLRRSLGLIGVLTVVGVLVYVFVIRDTKPDPTFLKTEYEEVQDRKLGDGGDVAPLPKIVFTDVTERSGLKFDHENGARGEK